eukprot:8262924-Alexandrium_andersonii.AAC.1
MPANRAGSARVPRGCALLRQRRRAMAEIVQQHVQALADARDDLLEEDDPLAICVDPAAFGAGLRARVGAVRLVEPE